LRVRCPWARSPASVSEAARWTTGRASRNTEIFTLRNGKIVDVEVYFGWSILHEAPEDGFVKSASARNFTYASRSHQSGDRMFAFTSEIGASRHCAAMQNLVAIGA
jgi:hypothetical protein